MVSIDHSGTDRIGALLAYEIGQEVAGHPAMALASDTDDGWKVILLTFGNGTATTYALTLVFKNFDQQFDYYVTTFVGECPGSAIPACAHDLVAGIAGPVMDYRSAWREFSAPGRIDKRDGDTGPQE